MVFGKSSLLGKVSAAVAEEDGLLGVVPLGVARHAVVADRGLAALRALVHLVLVPAVLHQRLVVRELEGG